MDDLTLPMNVDVYLNLHKSKGGVRVYSIMHKGRVVGYSSTLTLKDCTFLVNPKAQVRVQEKKRKEVHAKVRGTLVSVDPHPTSLEIMKSDEGGWLVAFLGYCPYTTAGFVAMDSELVSESKDCHIISIADEVRMTESAGWVIPDLSLYQRSLGSIHSKDLFGDTDGQDAAA
ncbi:hypothetical protein AB6D11_00345 [Vibrio splendidus]